MCGIAGQIDFRGRPVDPEAVRRMATIQSHRGPDGEGAVLWDDDARVTRVDRLEGLEDREGCPTGALAHRRLSIIDLTPGGAQPMASPCGRYWITYNGEIYNYVELGRRLTEAGEHFTTTSDTEVLLRAFVRWGPECLERLNGMFAFAIWDVRERRLFCARDRLGVKPFYYSFQDGRFLFASEPKGILAALKTRPSVDLEAVADYLALSFVASSKTMFSGIEKLEPGHALRVDGDGIRVGAWWSPVFDPAPAAPDAERLRELLRDSMRLQVRSDVEVGAHLSGGVDSSLVCSLAAPCLSGLRTFSARFAEGEAFDESPWARRVASSIGATHVELEPERRELRELLPKIVYHLDEPVEGPAVVGKYYVAQSVSHAVKVVLTGHGGDELFGGYDWYVKNLFTSAVFGGRGQLGAHDPGSFVWETLTRTEKPQRLVRSLVKNLGDRDLARIFARNWSRLDPARLRRLVRFDVNGDTPEARVVEEFRRLPERRGGDRMFKFDQRHYLASLLTSEDRLSMAFSVESRVPLLDHRIAELAGTLGFERKTVPGVSKSLLREAARGVVVPEVLDRTDKRGFPVPVGAWLTDPRLELLETFVFNGHDFPKTYFDLDQVRKMARSRFRVGTAWSERLWRVLNVCVWADVFGMG